MYQMLWPIFLAPTGSEENMNELCCLCGEPLEPGDIRTHIYEDKLVWSTKYHRMVPVRVTLEDGSTEKVMHPLCPMKLGAPLAMFGADGEHMYG